MIRTWDCRTADKEMQAQLVRHAAAYRQLCHASMNAENDAVRVRTTGGVVTSLDTNPEPLQRSLR